MSEEKKGYYKTNFGPEESDTVIKARKDHE
jgi:hypothetical protein